MVADIFQDAGEETKNSNHEVFIEKTVINGDSIELRGRYITGNIGRIPPVVIQASRKRLSQLLSDSAEHWFAPDLTDGEINLLVGKVLRLAVYTETRTRIGSIVTLAEDGEAYERQVWENF